LGGAFSINEGDRVIRKKVWAENMKVKALLDYFICRRKYNMKVHIQDRLKNKVTNTEAEILIPTSTLNRIEITNKMQPFSRIYYSSVS
jgi:hypothetical protein